ncbi:MAG: GNAT family N-acetyltransferase [Rhizobiaceae bacterium]|nr:GNAT family N-acetyltransferase [Rhizobiaceae bacterium]
MDIRKALSSDTAALIDVIDRAYEIYRIELPDLPDVSAGVAEEIETGNVWVADDDGVIGGVFLMLNPEPAVLTNIAVDPLQAGKGIGKALIMRAED